MLMTNPLPIISISSEMLEGWQAEKAAIAQQIAELQRREMILDRKLEAAAIFLSDGEPDQPKPDPTNLVEAIARIINSASGPMTRKQLKAILETEGFPPERLSNYFYTAIARLKERRRISVLANGSIGKPQ